MDGHRPAGRRAEAGPLLRLQSCASMLALCDKEILPDVIPTFVGLCP